VIGFSSAFHLSFTGNGIDTWGDFVSGTITTFVTSPTGYYVPEYSNNILAFAGISFGIFTQVLYVFLGIILLLNLLVAVLWETYATVSVIAEVEYRWHVAQPFKTGFSFLWPSPFTIIHVFLLLCGSVIFAIGKWCGFKVTKKYDLYKRAREEVPPGLPTNHQLLMNGMVVHFLKADLGDSYKDLLHTGAKVFRDDTFSKSTDE